jgi:VCBS repeat-containing protein
VPAATGVLKNDSDAESSPLQAQLVGGPAHGTLTLLPDGSFTYTPQAGFAGTDSFTYRASEGAVASGPATVSLTVTASTCAPRASVRVTTTIVDGKQQATIEALPLADRTNNRLVELRFGTFRNGTVTLGGQPIVGGGTYTPPADTTRTTFTVERVQPGQATTIPLTVVDACGAWPTFVGGGAGAGF